MKKLLMLSGLLSWFAMANAQCPTISPTGHDTCRIGTGTAVLGASGSTGFYSWYDAATGGNFLGSGASFTTPVISSTTNYFVAAADTNRGLNFDGTNDYVAIDNFTYSGVGHTAVTVETWIRTTDGSDQMIASYDRSEFWRLSVNGNGAGTGQIGWNIMTSAGQLDFGSNGTVNDGEWHHVACVYDNGLASIYIDGVLDNQTTQGTSFGSALTRFGFLSAGSEATSFNGTNTPFWPFNGDMDEFRIWNTARTQAEIQNNMFVCLTGAEAGLQVYLPMEDGPGTTTVSDLVASNDGTMFNMNPATDWITSDRDYSCPTCESSRTTVTATVSGASPVDLGPDYFTSCGLTSLTLDAGAGYANYNWSTTETTQTINVSSPGTYWVVVDDGGSCYDSDTIVVSEGGLGTPPTSPTANDTCKIGSGSLTLTASGSTGNYNWYDAPTGGTHLDTGMTYTTPVLVASTTYYVSATEQNQGLNFDGSNDYVALNSSYASTGIREVTVEAWIRTTKTGAQIIASYDRSDYWRFGVSSTGGSAGQVTWSCGTDAGILDMSSTGTVNDGSWHHVAAVYDNGNATIYIDGVQDGTASLGTTIGTGTTRFGFIATGSETASFNGNQTVSRFQGDIDEVRIWNVAKSQAEIQANMNNCLNGAVDGLFAYYTFQDGTGTTLSDVFSGQDGTLFNMNNADWVDSDYMYSCEACESPRVAVNANIGAGSPVDLGPDVFASCVGGSTIFDAGAGYANYNWSTTETTQTISVSTPNTYSVIVDDGSGCTDADTVIFSSATGASDMCLNFDGGNDYVAISNVSYTAGGQTAVTVEAWINTSNGGNQIIASFDRNEYWRLGVNGNGGGTGQIEWDLMTNAGQLDFGSVGTVHDGNWHHIAAVYDNGTASIYIDGELDNQTTFGTTFGTGSTRFGFVGVGSEATTFNGSRGPTTEFDGDIEEVRIWNVAKSQNEIRQAMCTSFEGAQNGLLVYYNFNDGTGTNVTDVANGNDGTMFNMNAADWVTSGAPTGHSSTFLYPGSWAGQTLTLTSCTGDQVEISNVSGTLDGMHLYVVEDDPSEQTGLLVLTTGNHYYGVFQTNSGTETYDVTYTYTNHPLFVGTNENSLYLADRNDGSSTPWTDNTATLNTGTDELTINYSGRKEIIVDSKEFVWTGATNTDWNTANNWLPTSVPPAGADIRVPDVTNQPVLDMDRQIGYMDIEALATVDLNGFTLSMTEDLTVSGSIISNSGSLTFNGTTAQQILTLNTVLDIENITVDNVNNVTTSVGGIDLRGTFTLTNGDFETNDSLRFISDATGTARLAEITGGTLNGNIIVERYIDAGETYWRYFGSAVSGATLAQFNDDFTTAGYPGSLFPGFGWISAYNYDETAGPGLGYNPTTGASQVMGIGEGWQIWCGDTITGTQPFTWDLRGPANQGNINLPVTYNNFGLPNEDGFCLVSNPYASTIDWDDTDWTKTNMANAVYIQDPDNQQYATYIGGASTNGGSQFIASQQSFWVQAFAASPVLQATEGVKSSVDQQFIKSGTASPGMKITLQDNQEFDEVVMRHVDATSDAFDWQWDARKFWGGWGLYPQLSLIGAGLEDMTIHSFDKGNQEWQIPLRAVVFADGNYNINFNNISEMDVPCMVLEDTYDGNTYPIYEGASYTFFMDDSTWLPRFIIHVGKSYDYTTQDASCFGDMNGEIMLDLDLPTTINYNLTVDQNTTAQTGFGDPLVLTALTSGIYQIEVPSLTNMCNQTIFNFTIDQPSEMSGTAIIVNETLGTDGSIVPTIVGGTAPYSYDWSNGETGSSIDNLNAGTYGLTVTDANGCQYTETYTVNSVLGIEDESTEVYITYNNESGQILITGLSIDQPTVFILYATDGKKVQEYLVNPGTDQQLLNVSSELAPGIYHLRAKDLTFKFKK